MKRVAAVMLMAGSLAVAGQALAHGRGGDGGAVVGALLGGAVIGALVGAAVAPQPVYAVPVYAQPAYQPVYAQPAYQPAYAQPVYAQPGPPPGSCYDNYRGAYVPCGPPPPRGYYQQQEW